MKIFHPDHIIKTLLSVMYISLVVAFALSIAEQDWLSAFLTFLTLFLMQIPRFVKRKYDLYIPRSVLAVIIIFIYSTLFLGEVQGFYDKFFWWDIVLHIGSAATFALLGLVILLLLARSKKISAHPLLLSIFSFSFAVAIGTLWEIIEFGADYYLGTNMQRSGLTDTMGDLIVDACGAVIVSTLAYFYLYSGTLDIIDKVIDRTVKKNSL